VNEHNGWRGGHVLLSFGVLCGGVPRSAGNEQLLRLEPPEHVIGDIAPAVIDRGGVAHAGEAVVIGEDDTGVTLQPPE